MFDGFLMFTQALGGFLQNPIVILYVLGATQLGIIVGMLPGLTATMGVALMTTLTFKMAPDTAVLILVCMYVGAIYGGSRSAILLWMAIRWPGRGWPAGLSASPPPARFWARSSDC